MRKIAFMLFASAFLASCGGSSEKTETPLVDSTAVCCDSTKSTCVDSLKLDTTVVK